MAKIKVLHVTSGLDPTSGGPARALVGLVLAQQRAGMDCEVFSTWSGTLDRAYFKELRLAGIPIGLVGPSRRPLQWHPDLSASLEAAIKGADIVHIHALWEQVQHEAARIARKFQIPYIFRTCGMLDPWSLTQSKLGKQMYMEVRLRNDIGDAAALHFTSEEERLLVEPLELGVRTLVIENGLDLREFTYLPPRGLFRKSIPRIGDRRIILTLSRIHPKKGFDILIPAFAKARLSNAVLVIAGKDDDSNYMAELLALVAREGIEDRIIFTGILDSRRRLEALVDADLFVLPSYQENFGIAVVEAAAAGLPAIISEKVNIKEEITRAGAGDVVRLDEDELAAKLQEWMADPQRRAESGKLGREFALKRYDWDPIAVRWRTEYARMIVENKPR